MFDLAVKQVLEEEGLLSNDPIDDPNGGLTKYGISQKQNPDVDVASLTRDTAIAIYKVRYWLRNRCQDMPWPVSVVVFDADVNQGDMPAAKLLQMSLGVTVDGIISAGGQTLTALRYRDPWEVSARMLAKRAVRYSKSNLWSRDGEGWMYRLACLSLAAGRLLS
jgi:lysozyme family protein